MGKCGDLRLTPGAPRLKVGGQDRKIYGEKSVSDNISHHIVRAERKFLSARIFLSAGDRERKNRNGMAVKR